MKTEDPCSRLSVASGFSCGRQYTNPEKAHGSGHKRSLTSYTQLDLQDLHDSPVPQSDGGDGR